MGLAAPQLRRPERPSLAVLGRARTALAYGSLATVGVIGVAIAVLSADPRSTIVQGGGRGLPAWMVGPLGGLTSGHLQLLRFYVLIGLMCAAYLGVIALGGHIRARWVLGTVAGLHVAFLLAPPLLSTDVFNYIDYARLGVLHGIDPYAHGPVAARHDAVYHYTAWRHMASAYGPLFTIATYPLAHVSIAAALWVLKGVTAAASLGCVAMVWLIARQMDRRPATAAAVFGLNPVLLVWTVGGAHNDILMLLLMLVGVWLGLRAREGLAGAALIAGAAVKATAGLVIPFLLLRSPRRWRLIASVAAASAAVYGVAIVAFPGHPLAVIDVLARQHQFVGYNSVPKELALLFGFPGVTPGVRLLALFTLGCSLAWIAFRVWRGADWVAACGWAMVAVVVTSTWFLAWYAVWPLAFAAVSRDRRLMVATLGLQAFWLANHVPHFTL
ncbi:MAG: alpha,6-mannosyltransferase [Thermoleophilaceae bacterium]|jgi:alpha-1,6-mannosyltransferase|nr:alpha,6-mannosyltransferase [Thermoleophilaceae bacterium]MEA2469780.1 alpha,6-mannosyltransferase [Thermoleophilaceae bacterium]